MYAVLGEGGVGDAKSPPCRLGQRRASLVKLNVSPKCKRVTLGFYFSMGFLHLAQQV